MLSDELLEYYGITPGLFGGDVIFPEGVAEVWDQAYASNQYVRSIVIPKGVTRIGKGAFQGCAGLVSVTLPDGLTEIDSGAFKDCPMLRTVNIPDSVNVIEKGVFYNCRSLEDIVIPDGVTQIGMVTFHGCKSLRSVRLPDSVKIIDTWAFAYCEQLRSITIPDGVTKIESNAFYGCESLRSVVIPDSVTGIGGTAFADCENLSSIIVPDSVTELSADAFGNCPKITVVCGEGSTAHRVCEGSRVTCIFDYQYKAFNGVIPPGIERLSSPFIADEEEPYVFISYSHKDRDRVLQIIKALYESGWRIWYDEGLTIGEKYDETLHAHVENCSAFLLFITDNSVESLYIGENEIPWAKKFKKPIVKCTLDVGADIAIDPEHLFAAVTSDDIEPALERIEGLTKGDPREAKGISVAVNPAERDGGGNGFACCLYSDNSRDTAQAIMLEQRNSGCNLYDAVADGTDEEKLRDSACLIVFLDRAYLADKELTALLIEEYSAGRDIAVCQLEDIEDADLPDELTGLHRLHWLSFAHGITADMNSNLARHLQKRGCRNTSILPGFEYEKTDSGIIIKKYKGKDPELTIESEYGGVPVIEIADGAFKNCNRIKMLKIRKGVVRIGDNAFEGCAGLTSLTLPDSVTEIGEWAFKNCEALHTAVIPDSIAEIKKGMFYECGNLADVTLPDSVTKIGDQAFGDCSSLVSISLPKSVRELGENAFRRCFKLTALRIPRGMTAIPSGMCYDCRALSKITIPDSVTEIGDHALGMCKSLTSVFIPDSVTKIGRGAFSQCSNLTEVNIPYGLTKLERSTFALCEKLETIVLPYGMKEIEDEAFFRCTRLTTVTIPDSVTKMGKWVFMGDIFATAICSPDSYAWKYCESVELRVESPTPSASSGKSGRGGFFGRLFGKR